MAAQDARHSLVALTRFGLGVRPGELAGIGLHARDFVLGQLTGDRAGQVVERLPDTGAILTSYKDYRAARSVAKVKLDLPNPAGEIYRTDVLARARQAVMTDTPFVERLVMFWSNFFAIGADKGAKVRAIAGAFEREAIRPYVLGRFADMLEAATKHPAMLAYLDNDRSIGPNSVSGRRRGGGLNENLARETLELHSLGVDGGYTQADVTALAAIITGWQVTSRERDTGSFYFNRAAHEPGSFTVLGRAYPDKGVAQGEAALADLATHPATARHVARRLAAHFVAASPPPGLVAVLADAFSASGGDLRAVAAALASADAAWEAPPGKFLPPYDLMVACHRLVGIEPTERIFLRAVGGLAQPTWSPDSPAGWPDADLHWAAPDALLERLDWTSRVADAAAGTTDVVGLAVDVLGPRLLPETRLGIARAESRPQALALLMSSVEFQTR